MLSFILLNIFHWDFSFAVRIGRWPADGISLPEAIALKTCTLIRSGSTGLHMKAPNKVPKEAPLSRSREKAGLLFLWKTDGSFHWPILKQRGLLLWSCYNQGSFWKTSMVLETNFLRFGIRNSYEGSLCRKRPHTEKHHFFSATQAK